MDDLTAQLVCGEHILTRDDVARLLDPDGESDDVDIDGDELGHGWL